MNEDVAFWTQLVDAYRLAPDWIKAVVPLTIITLFSALPFWGMASFLRRHVEAKRKQMEGSLAYVIHRDSNDQICIYRHDKGIPDDAKMLLSVEKLIEEHHLLEKSFPYVKKGPNIH